MCDFNIDITKENCSGFDKLEEICDTFNLRNLLKSETCYTNNSCSYAETTLKTYVKLKIC